MDIPSISSIDILLHLISEDPKTNAPYSNHPLIVDNVPSTTISQLFTNVPPIEVDVHLDYLNVTTSTIDEYRIVLHCRD